MRAILFHILFIIICLNTAWCVAQTPAANFPIQNEISNPIDEYYIRKYDIRFHSSLKPYLHTTLDSLNDNDIPYRHFSAHIYNMRKEFIENSDKKSFSVQMLPQLDFQLGYDMLNNKPLTEISGGMFLRADINRKITAVFQSIGGSVTLPGFTDTLAQAYGVVPGQGIAYLSGIRDTASSVPFRKYSYSNFSGYLSWSPRKFINFQAGKGKHFIGDGYRSLLLSDVANNYPYFKTSLNIWRLQYSSWCSWFLDIQNANGFKENFRNKFGTFHYLSWNATKNLNFSLFENIIWQGNDTNRARGFDLSDY